MIGRMSQSTPGPSSANQTFVRFLIGFAMVEGVLLSAIVLAMVFEVISTDLMIPLLIAVALVGGAVMTWRILTLNKQRQRGAEGSSHLPQSDPGEPSTLNGLGDSDPMAKYRDPNR